VTRTQAWLKDWRTDRRTDGQGRTAGESAGPAPRAAVPGAAGGQPESTLLPNRCVQRFRNSGIWWLPDGQTLGPGYRPSRRDCSGPVARALLAWGPSTAAAAAAGARPSRGPVVTVTVQLLAQWPAVAAARACGGTARWPSHCALVPDPVQTHGGLNLTPLVACSNPIVSVQHRTIMV